MLHEIYDSKEHAHKEDAGTASAIMARVNVLKTTRPPPTRSKRLAAQIRRRSKRL